MTQEKGIVINWKNISAVIVICSALFTLGYNVKSNTTKSNQTDERLTKYIKRFNDFQKDALKDRLKLENRITKLETNETK